MKRPLVLALIGLLIFAGTAIAAFSTGTYAGKTDQKLGIQLTVNKTTMLSGKYTANYTCRLANGSISHAHAQPTVLGQAPIGPGGKIDTHQHTPDGTDRVHLVATLNGKTATGSFNETYTNSSQTTCHSGVVKFKIKH